MSMHLCFTFRVFLRIVLVLLLSSCKKDEDNSLQSTAARIGIDFYTSDDDSPDGSSFSRYTSSHEWTTVELQNVTVPDSTHFINIWVQAWSPDSGAMIFFGRIDVRRNGGFVSRSQFACNDTAGWWGEWFYDGNPNDSGDDGAHEYDNHLLSIAPGEWEDESALRILVPGERYSSAAFLYDKIPVNPRDTILFFARLGIP